MWKKFAINLLRNRILYIVFLCLLAVASLIVLGTKGVRFTKSNAQLLPSSDSAAIHFEEFHHTFGKDDNLIVIGMFSHDLFQEKNFTKWLTLKNKIEKIDGVKDVFSLDEAVILKKDTINKAFVSQKLIPKVGNVADFKKAFHTIEQLPFYEGLLYNKKTGAIQTLVYLESDIVDSKKREKVVIEIKSLLDQYETEAQLKTHLSGMPVIRTMNAMELKSESTKFILLALLVTVLVFFMLYRSVKSSLITLLIMVFSVLISFATLAALNYEVTVLTAIVPPLLIIISVQNIIFLINEYLLEYQILKNKAKALVSMIYKIGSPLLLINLTTAFGFFSFVFTESATLKEFGWLSTITVMVISFLALLIIPIFLSFSKPLKTSNFDHKIEDFFARNIIDKFVFVVEKKRKLVYLICGIVSVLSIYGMFEMKRTGNMLDDMSKNADFYKDISFFDENFNGILPLEIVIKGKPNSAFNQKTLEKVNELQDYIDSLGHSSKPISVVNLSKFARQAFYNGDPSEYKVPAKNEYSFIASYLKNSKGNENMLKNYIDSTHSQVRVTTLLKNADSEKMEESILLIQNKLDTLFPKEKSVVYQTGLAYVFMQGTKYLTNDLLLSIVIAVVIIIIFMILMFRSKRMIFVALLPNLLPLLVTAGAMGIFGIPLKPSTILVFNIAFGIVVDNSIHFLSRYRQELHRNNSNIHLSVVTAMKEAGKSIIFTSIVLFIGFSVFMFSSFGGIVALGGLTALALLISMATNIILLPSLILSDHKATDDEFLNPEIDVFNEEELEIDDDEVKEIEKEIED